MAIDGIALSVATVAITSTAGAFYQMLPPISEVRRRSVGDPDFAADVRIGEAVASAIALAIGGIASNLSGSPTPVMVAAIFALMLSLIYEWTLRSNGPEKSYA